MAKNKPYVDKKSKSYLNRKTKSYGHKKHKPYVKPKDPLSKESYWDSEINSLLTI